MANIADWVLKSNNNELEPGEEILSALAVSVHNKVKYMASGVLGGVIGATIARQMLKKKNQKNKLTQPKPSVIKYPKGAVILALTSKRLLVYRLNLLGRPKALGASYSINDLATAESIIEKINYTLLIAFADGGTVAHDVSKTQSNELNKFIETIASSK